MSVYIKSISIGTISGGIVIFGNAGNISPPSGSTSGSGSSSQMPMPLLREMAREITLLLMVNKNSEIFLTVLDLNTCHHRNIKSKHKQTRT